MQPRPIDRLAMALLGGGALCMPAGRAAAQEYCVACVEPPAVYRCVIDGAQPGGKQPLQMLCVTAMTKEGRHASCSLKGGTVFDCNGPVKRVSWAAYNALPASAPPAPKQEQAKQDPSAPAKTVEEMAKRAGDKTAEQAKSFGQTVGDTGKKTWRCIASLFTRCGE